MDRSPGTGLLVSAKDRAIIPAACTTPFRAIRSRPPLVVAGPGVACARGYGCAGLQMCDRPGCHEPPVTSPRNPARYCCPACRQAVRNVLDRERKWLSRGTLDGRTKRSIEYQAVRRHPSAATQYRQPATVSGTSGVTIPPGHAGRQLSRGAWRLVCLSRLIYSQEPQHAPETHSGSRATAASAPNRLVLGGPSLRA